MRGLNWAEPPLSLSLSQASMEFYSPVEREQGVHSTRLRNHKSKWYRFETTMLAEDDATIGRNGGEKARKGKRKKERKMEKGRVVTSGAFN